MRVIHVVPSLAARTGGPAFTAVESALAVRELGIETTLFATDMASAASAGRQRAVEGAELPPGHEDLNIRLYPVRRPYRFALSPALARALTQEVGKADVVHVHSLFLFPQLAAYRAARRRGVPYVVSPSGALDPHLRRRSPVAKAVADRLWQRRMLDQAALLHYKTEEEARLTAELGLAAPVAVVPNGIRWADFQRPVAADAFRARYVGGDGPVVLALGRLSHKKGLDVLVQSFALARRQVPDARLVIAGPDDEGLRPALAEAARRAGLDSAVQFPEMLAGDERLAALAAADVFALPSATENFGLAAVEAMAAGRAVVLSPAVNIASDAAAAAAAVVCSPAPEELGAELAELLADPARRSALGTRAREFARRYDWSEVAPQWAAMYEDAARRPWRT